MKQLFEQPFSDWQMPEVDPQKIEIGFDTEYESDSRTSMMVGGKLIDVNQRRLEDIISIQLGFNYMNKAPVLYMLHREHDDPVFTFSDVMKLLKKYLKSVGVYKSLYNSKRALTLEMLTFWGGVDLSVFKDYENIITEGAPKHTDKTGKIVTVGGNTVFTSRPIKLKVRDKSRNPVFISQKDRLVLRDMTKLAPGKLNLEGLGDLINEQKIDTEKWDKADGFQLGYYKSHMSELWKNRQNDFIDYALEDVVITAKYAAFILNFQKTLSAEGYGDFKPARLKSSLGSIVASIIGHENQQSAGWIVDAVIKQVAQKEATGKVPDADIEKMLKGLCHADLEKDDDNKLVFNYHFDEIYTNPTVDNFRNWLYKHLDFDKIRKGYYFPRKDRTSSSYHKHLVNDIKNKIDCAQNKLFKYANAAYHGGYNLVQQTGIFPAGGEKRDIDLSGAYSEAGHLIPDLAVALGTVGNNIKKKEFKNLPAADFKKLVCSTRKCNGPYSVGVGQFDIEYPEDYKGFVITPKQVEDGPRYFRKIENVTLSYTDAYAAWICGAQVFTHWFAFVKQARIKPGSLEGVCPNGHIQDIFQKRREQCVHDSPEDKMNKNVVNQAYGVSAEGLKEKKSPDFNNGRPYFVPFSGITNPLIAMQYTAITRLHIITLQQAIWKVDPSAKFLNNVTDGCLIWTKKPLNPGDVIKAMDDITSRSNPLYHDMVHNFFDGQYIKWKDGTSGETANLRTRLTFSRDNNLHAMVGISKSVENSPKNIFANYLDSSRHYIDVENTQITGITQMRHERKFQHLQTSWRQPSKLYFSYDMAQVPIKYHTFGKYVIWNTRPYESEDEFGLVWERGRQLMKYGCWYSADYAAYFDRTLKELLAGYKVLIKFWRDDKDDWDGNTYKHLGYEVYRNWCFFVARQNLDIDDSYDKIADRFNDYGWMYLKANVDHGLPQQQSFKATIHRIQQRNVRLFVNHVLLHEVGLI